MRIPLVFAIAFAAACGGAPLDSSLHDQLIGRWHNDVDAVVVEIASIDPATGRIDGREWAATSPSTTHPLIGWLADSAPRAGMDHVVPISFSTSLFEYGTLPSWSGFVRDGRLVTMHYLVWPNRTYAWDHITSFAETWTRER